MRVSNQSVLPNFIIGGAMKAGTTFLHHVLAQHPNVFIPNGEVYFFCIDDTIQHPDFWRVHDYDRDFRRNIEWCRSLFDSASNDQLIGEDSTTYLPSPKVPGRIQNLMPDVKLIFLLRDPVARTYSHYWHRVKTGRAVYHFERELELASSNLYLRSFYKKQLKRYFDIFPREQIKVIISEQLFECPKKIINEVYDFLGLKRINYEYPNKNKSPMPVSLRLQLFINYLANGTRQKRNKYMPGMTNMEGLSLSNRIFKNLLFRLRRCNISSDSYPTIKNELQNRLSRVFRRENEGISNLIGVDVTTYWPSMK